MSKSTQVIIVIAAGLLIIGGIIFAFFYSGGAKIEPPKVVDETAPVAKVELKPEERAPINMPPLTDGEKDLNAAKNIALAFVERFGTFTNENGYTSMKELSSMMTSGAQKWLLNEYIPQMKKAHPADGFFYRVTTRAPGADVVSQDANALELNVFTQRQETKDKEVGAEFLQKISIKMVKSGATWLIDGIYWEKLK